MQRGSCLLCLMLNARYAHEEWSWVQYYNVDVYALLLTCALLIVFIV